MANKVDEILEDAVRRVGMLALFGDSTEAAELRNVLEELKTAIAEERKIPPRNTAKLVEEIREINASLDRPDALRLIRGHVYAALRYRPRICDVNSIEALTGRIVNSILEGKIIKGAKDAITAVVSATLAIAYEPIKET